MKIRDHKLFGYETYEPEWPAELPMLWLVTTPDGRKFVSDRFTAIVPGLVESDDSDRWMMTSASKDFGPIPLVIPELSTQPLRPKYLHRLTSLGITVHEAGKGNPQHLYLDGEHVGYLSPLRDMDPFEPLGSGSRNVHLRMTVADIPAVRVVAGYLFGFCGRDDAFDEWDIAATVLNGQAS